MIEEIPRIIMQYMPSNTSASFDTISGVGNLFTMLVVLGVAASIKPIASMILLFVTVNSLTYQKPLADCFTLTLFSPIFIIIFYFTFHVITRLLLSLTLKPS